MQLKKAGILLGVVLAVSCSEQKHVKNTNFDTKAFFGQEAARLRSASKGMLKTMVFRDKQQQLEIKDTINWEAELAPFMQVHLADPAFAGVFKADTAYAAGKMQIRYVAKDEKEEIKQVTIALDGERIETITCVLAGENSLYKKGKTLRYKPDSGYVITGMQQVNYLEETIYSVGARWLD